MVTVLIANCHLMTALVQLWRLGNVRITLSPSGWYRYSQAAHSNRYQDGKGAGFKAHYLATFPLCCSRPGILGCHVEHDQCIGMTRAEADVRTKLYIADTRQKLGVRQ